MVYIENFEMDGGKRRKKRSNAGKKRGPRKVTRKRRSNAGKKRIHYRVRSATSDKLRKRRSNVGKSRRKYKKRKSSSWFGF
jgi:hypothetical protein